MIHVVHSLFAPHHHNNQKAKILWHQSILVLLALLVVGRSLIDVFAGVKPGVLGYASQIDPQKIVQLTNTERSAQGLPALTYNSALAAAAKAKAEDMLSQGYWAHVSPTGTEPWSFITKSGYQYQHAGENLARDFSNSPAVVAAWMASPTHRQNIIDKRYRDIGVAVMDGYINGVETTIVVQMFGVTVADNAKPIEKVAAAGNSVKNAPLPSDPEVPTTPPSIVPSENKIYPQTGLSPFEVKKSLSVSLVIVIIFSLFIDWLVVWKENIIRVSGKTWAHLTFFLGLFAILFVIRQGLIL